MRHTNIIKEEDNLAERGAPIAIEIGVEIEIPSMQENSGYDVGARPPARSRNCQQKKTVKIAWNNT